MTSPITPHRTSPSLRVLILVAMSAVVAGCASTPHSPQLTPPTSSPVNTPAASAGEAAAAPMSTSGTTGTAAPPLSDPVDLLPDHVPAAASDDLWNRMRQGFAMPALDNELVRTRERWYAGQPDYIERMSTRGSRYLYFIVEELERRGMPTELALLPFVESAFNPTAVSSARAEGMWQFMPATGRTYQLTQNIFRDDRRDVLESTRAALDYLQRLHTMFDDWHLALAAYNWGEGNVQRAIAKNAARGLPTDYDSLSMPIETRHYVPKLQALKNIVSQPEAFNVSLIELPNHPYFQTVPIQRDIDVAVAAKLAGLSLADFHTLNPSQKKPVILAAGTPQILLPYDNASLFETNLARYKGPLATWTAWQVPRTMKTGEAAKLVGMSDDKLRTINGIPPKMLVKSGSTLLVERAGARMHQDVPEQLAESASMSLAPDLPPLKKITVHATRGDSVASLAKRYRLNPAQVAQWNRLPTAASLPRGRALVLWLPANAVAAAAKPRPVLLASAGRSATSAASDRKAHTLSPSTLKGRPAAARPRSEAAPARTGAASKSRASASTRKAAPATSKTAASRKASTRSKPSTAKRGGEASSTRKIAGASRASSS